MDAEEIDEELAALRRGLEEWNGLYEVLLELFTALVTTHPRPLVVAQLLHRSMREWDQKRMPLTGRSIQLLAALRQTANTVAAVDDPKGLDREQRRRENDADD